MWQTVALIVGDQLPGKNRDAVKGFGNFKQDWILTLSARLEATSQKLSISVTPRGLSCHRGSQVVPNL